ncbi:hypothetical protein ACE14D_21520, partial [Streptomyces sp. Act-28]
LLAFRRTARGAGVVCVANTTDRAVEIPRPGGPDGRLLLADSVEREPVPEGGSEGRAGTVLVPPDSCSWWAI